MTSFPYKYYFKFIHLFIILYLVSTYYLKIKFLEDIPSTYLSIKKYLITICFFYLWTIKFLIKFSIKNNMFFEHLISLFYLSFHIINVIRQCNSTLEHIIMDTHRNILSHFSEITKKRVLITDDSKSNTQSTMIAQDNTIVTVGVAFNGFKLTPHGQAYNATVTSVQHNNDIDQLNTLPSKIENMQVILGPVNANIVFIKTGLHNHVHTALQMGNYHYSIGFLTSMKGLSKLSDARFDHFQKTMESNTPINITNPKVQYISEPSAFLRIRTNQATVLKYGQEYLKYINQNKYLKERINTLSQKASMNYDSDNINEQQLIDMIVKHDDNIQNNKPHPKTDHQIQQQLAGIDKQQQAQKKPNNPNKNPIPKLTDDNTNN